MYFLYKITTVEFGFKEFSCSSEELLSYFFFRLWLVVSSSIISRYLYSSFSPSVQMIPYWAVQFIQLFLFSLFLL